MKPLIVLLGAFVIGLIIIRLLKKTFNWQLAGRIAMAVMLVFTAIGHFVFTEGMIEMIPEMIPFKKEMVYATGILEIVFAIGLLLPTIQTKVGWGVILFFLALLPANIKAAMENINYQTGALDGHGLDYLWFRVPLQLFFIVWVYFMAIRKNASTVKK